MAEQLLRSSCQSTNPFPQPTPRTIKMEDYFRTPEIVRHDLETYATKLGADKTPADLSTRNMIGITCFSGESCGGEKYLRRAAVALGMAEKQTEVESTAEVLARLKGIAGIKVYPLMDKTYFTFQNVQHDLAAFAAAIGHGMTIVGLSTRNLESIGRVVCANEEPCLPTTYLLKAGVALGIAKNMTKGQPKGAPALKALKHLVGIEIVEYPSMDAAYFTQENIRKDLLAYAAKLGPGKTIDDLSTENMPDLDAVCSNGEPCNGRTYIGRAGKGLAMANDTRGADSKAAEILFQLKHRSGLLKRTALLA
ncbi:hypothetical protein HZA43_00340 [Candidatus Peregrinibacteria bacterium]|nr:hypothetical protein [Candidatus Peregrinibacteria bacterium]